MYFRDLLPRLVKAGDDGNCGSAAVCDTLCLQVCHWTVALLSTTTNFYGGIEKYLCDDMNWPLPVALIIDTSQWRMLKRIASVLNGVIKVDCLAVNNISYALEVILYFTLQETDGLIYSPFA